MKYQIILESKKLIDDQEFEKLAKKYVPPGFKLLEARSLEGIREEVYACDAMKKAVVQEMDDWKKEHKKHSGGKYKVEEIARHPSNGPIDRISCKCGKSIIAFRKTKDPLE